MIRLILNVVLIVILALSVWGGFKRGLIRTVAGIIAIIHAISSDYLCLQFRV